MVPHRVGRACAQKVTAPKQRSSLRGRADDLRESIAFLAEPLAQMLVPGVSIAFRDDFWGVKALGSELRSLRLWSAASMEARTTFMRLVLPTGNHSTPQVSCATVLRCGVGLSQWQGPASR